MRCAAGCDNPQITKYTLNVQQLCCGQYYHLSCLLQYFRIRSGSLVFTKVSKEIIVASTPDSIFCPCCRQPFINLSNHLPEEFKNRLSDLLLFYINNSSAQQTPYLAPKSFKPNMHSLPDLTRLLLAKEEFQKFQTILQEWMQGNSLIGGNNRTWEKLLNLISENHLAISARSSAPTIAQFSPWLTHEAIMPPSIEEPIASDSIRKEPTYPSAIGTVFVLSFILVIALLAFPHLIRWEEAFMRDHYPKHEIDVGRLAKVDKRCNAFAIAALLVAAIFKKKLFSGRETFSAAMLKCLSGALLLLSLAILLPGYTEPI